MNTTTIIKHAAVVILLLLCNFAFAQREVTNTATTELYGYYQKEQNFKTIQAKVAEYETMIALMRYNFTRGNVYSDRDYTLLWSHKFKDGGEISTQIRYQFLIPFFKITVQHMVATFPNGNMEAITFNSKDKAIREMYADVYNMLVIRLITKIKPVKTLTNEQFQEEIKNIDKAAKSALKN